MAPSASLSSVTIAPLWLLLPPRIWHHPGRFRMETVPGRGSCMLIFEKRAGSSNSKLQTSNYPFPSPVVGPLLLSLYRKAGSTNRFLHQTSSSELQTPNYPFPYMENGLSRVFLPGAAHFLGVEYMRWFYFCLMKSGLVRYRSPLSGRKATTVLPAFSGRLAIWVAA